MPSSHVGQPCMVARRRAGAGAAAGRARPATGRGRPGRRVPDPTSAPAGRVAGAGADGAAWATIGHRGYTCMNIIIVSQTPSIAEEAARSMNRSWRRHRPCAACCAGAGDRLSRDSGTWRGGARRRRPWPRWPTLAGRTGRAAGRARRGPRRCPARNQRAWPLRAGRAAGPGQPPQRARRAPDPRSASCTTVNSISTSRAGVGGPASAPRHAAPERRLRAALDQLEAQFAEQSAAARRCSKSLLFDRELDAERCARRHAGRNGYIASGFGGRADPFGGGRAVPQGRRLRRPRAAIRCCRGRRRGQLRRRAQPATATWSRSTTATAT